MRRKLLWVSAYAIGMAFVEAAVVVYLRGLLGFGDGVVTLGAYAGVEIWREAATLLMLAAVGWLAGRRVAERLAFGVYAFGLWDIAYYLWLKVIIGWPESLFSPDVLFMIPVRWTGPVLAPVLIAALMCVSSIMLLRRVERGVRLHWTFLRIATIAAGILLALYTFMMDSLADWARGLPDWNSQYPGPFPWLLFLLAFALMALPLLRIMMSTELKEPNNDDL